jgi:hypothetical protein
MLGVRFGNTEHGGQIDLGCDAVGQWLAVEERRLPSVAPTQDGAALTGLGGFAEQCSPGSAEARTESRSVEIP